MCLRGMVNVTPAFLTLAKLALVSLTLVFSLSVLPQRACAEAPDPLLLTSASEDAYPPFAIVDADGDPDGFSVELLRAAAHAMGREVSFEIGTWAQVRRWLDQGTVQVLPLVGRTPEREGQYDFTFPYLTMHGAIVVRDDTTDVHSLDDLRGRSVAVMRGDSAEEFLKREPREFAIHTTPDYEKTLHWLSEGNCDAVVMQRIVALRLIESTGLTNLRVVEQPVEGLTQDFCFAVQEGDDETLALLNEGLAVVMADGTYRRLHSKWLGSLTLPVLGRIVVGGDHDYPPFEYLDESGRPAGYNVELTRAIARELDLDIEFRLGPWNEIREGLLRGEIDMAMGMFYSPERDAVFDFTSPFALVDHVAVVPAGTGKVPESLDDLAGLRVVAMRGDIMHELALERGLEPSLRLVSTQEEALRMVVEGDADVALVARVPASYWMAVNQWETLGVGVLPLATSEYGYAAPESRGDLLARFEEGLRVLDSTGEYRRIRAQWLDAYEESRISLDVVARYAAMVLTALAVVLLGIFLWTRTLSQRVAARTAELRHSEAQMRDMLNAAPEPILVQVDEKVAYANPALVALMGAGSPADLLGQPVLGAVPPARREAVRSILQGSVAPQGDVRQEETLTRMDGGEVIAEVSAVPLQYEGQDGTLVFMRDITDRKRAEEARRESARQLAVLMANLPGMAYRCLNAPGWPLQIVSEGCLALTGYTAHELVTQAFGPFESIIHPADRAYVRAVSDDAIVRDLPFQITYRIVTREGDIRHVWEQGRLVSQRTDGEQWLEGFISDITDRVRADEEIARQLGELQRWQTVMLAREGRVRELKREANDLYARLGEPLRYGTQVRAPVHREEGEGQ